MDSIERHPSPERHRRVEILEQKPVPLEGKGEDRLLIDEERCIAVLDGVTSHSSERLELEGKLFTYGQFAAEIGKQALIEAADINCPDEEFPYRVADHLAKRLEEHLVRLRRSGSILYEDPSFVFAAYFPKRRMLVRIGDCSVLADGEPLADMPNRELKVEERKMRLRERLARIYKHQNPSLSDEEARMAAKSATRPWQWKHRNKDEGASKFFGYGVVNGEHVPDSWVEFSSVDASEIVLATDGVPRDALRGTWQETEQEIARMPEGKVKPDDITYIRMRVIK